MCACPSAKAGTTVCVWRARTRHELSQIQIFQTAPHRHSFAISPRLCAQVLPEFRVPLISEGAGNAGRPTRPQPRVQMKKAHEHSHHGHTGTSRHSPRNGFTAYFALSPVTRLV